MALDLLDSTLECECCFEQICSTLLVACRLGHVICVDCLHKGLCFAVGNQKPFSCISIEGCPADYPESTLLHSARGDLKLHKAYSIMIAHISIDKVELQRLYQCPFCDNAMILDKESSFVEMDAVASLSKFSCDECGNASCIWCRRHWHEDRMMCFKNISEEEKATQDFLITCLCGCKFYRGEGCNKVSCSKCTRTWCWICKNEIDKDQPYQHFRDGVCKSTGPRALVLPSRRLDVGRLERFVQVLQDGRYNVVRGMLASGRVDVNRSQLEFMGHEGLTAMQIAIHLRSPELVTLLLECGANLPSEADYRKNIQYNTGSSQVNVIRALYQGGMRLTTEPCELVYAASVGNVHALEFFSNIGIFTLSDHKLAALSGIAFAPVIHFLLKRDLIDVSCLYNSTVLHQSNRLLDDNNQTAAIDDLPNNNQMTLLELAAKLGHVNTVRVLFKYGAVVPKKVYWRLPKHTCNVVLANLPFKRRLQWMYRYTFLWSLLHQTSFSL